VYAQIVPGEAARVVAREVMSNGLAEKMLNVFKRVANGIDKLEDCFSEHATTVLFLLFVLLVGMTRFLVRFLGAGGMPEIQKFVGELESFTAIFFARMINVSQPPMDVTPDGMFTMKDFGRKVAFRWLKNISGPVDTPDYIIPLETTTNDDAIGRFILPLVNAIDETAYEERYKLGTVTGVLIRSFATMTKAMLVASMSQGDVEDLYESASSYTSMVTLLDKKLPAWRPERNTIWSIIGIAQTLYSTIKPQMFDFIGTTLTKATLGEECQFAANASLKDCLTKTSEELADEYFEGIIKKYTNIAERKGLYRDPPVSDKEYIMSSRIIAQYNLDKIKNAKVMRDKKLEQLLVDYANRNKLNEIRIKTGEIGIKAGNEKLAKAIEDNLSQKDKREHENKMRDYRLQEMAKKLTDMDDKKQYDESNRDMQLKLLSQKLLRAEEAVQYAKKLEELKLETLKETLKQKKEWNEIQKDYAKANNAGKLKIVENKIIQGENKAKYENAVMKAKEELEERKIQDQAARADFAEKEASEKLAILKEKAIQATQKTDYDKEVQDVQLKIFGENLKNKEEQTKFEDKSRKEKLEMLAKAKKQKDAAEKFKRQLEQAKLEAMENIALRAEEKKDYENKVWKAQLEMLEEKKIGIKNKTDFDKATSTQKLKMLEIAVSKSSADEDFKKKFAQVRLDELNETFDFSAEMRQIKYDEAIKVMEDNDEKRENAMKHLDARRTEELSILVQKEEDRQEEEVYRLKILAKRLENMQKPPKPIPTVIINENQQSPDSDAEMD